MLNILWLGLLVIGIIMAAVNGNIDLVTKAALESAQAGVSFSLGLIAIMTFWLGMMKLAEEAGLVRVLAFLVRPFTRLLFPSVPKDHPAMGAIIMNISANVLGLGNAATPMGLIAMQELQKLNTQDKETATDAMCTLLALNTAGFTFIPATMIGILMQAGSQNPTEIVGPTIFATTCATMVAIISDRVLRKWRRNR